MKKLWYGIICIVAFISGYLSHKPKTIIKEITKEIIPADMQCYKKPIDFSAMCQNYSEMVIKKEKERLQEQEENLQDWQKGYQEGYKSR